MSETPVAMVDRVRMMADGSDGWDLSPNDRAALSHVLTRMVDAERACNRLILLESAAAFVVRRAEQARADSSLREKIDALALALAAPNGGSDGQ